MNAEVLRNDPDTSVAYLFPGDFYDINDSLPHYLYKKIEDSANRIRDKKNIVNKGSFMSGSSFGNVGTQFISNSRYEEDSWYFSLNGYELIDHDTRFFIQNGKYYLAKEEFQYNKDGQIAFKEKKLSNVRYREDNHQVLFPLTKNQYTAVRIAMDIVIYSLLLLLAYFLIGFPVMILLNISKGKAFSEKNNRMLRTMAIVMLVYTLGSLCLPYLVSFLFRSSIPGEFVRETYFTEELINHFKMFLYCIVLFFIAKAFKRGYKLQQEQDLTI